MVSVMFGERAGCLGPGKNARGDEFIDAVNVILKGCFNSLMVFAPLEQRLNTKRWKEHEQAWDIAKECSKLKNFFYEEK